MSRVSRREFLHAAGVAGAAVGTAGAAAAWPRPVRAQGGKGKVRFAYLQLGWAACEIIHKEDLLGKRGWQAEYNVVPGSPAGLVNTFAAGNVDAIDMSFALSAKMFEDKVPLKVTGVATAVLGAIVARKDSGITKVEDLKGRKIAAVVGTTTFLDIRTLTLKGYGFDVQKDTQLITAQAPPDMATMIAKKDVDAVIAWQPISDLIVQRGRKRPVHHDARQIVQQVHRDAFASGQCMVRRQDDDDLLAYEIDHLESVDVRRPAHECHVKSPGPQPGHGLDGVLAVQDEAEVRQVRGDERA